MVLHPSTDTWSRFQRGLGSVLGWCKFHASSLIPCSTKFPSLAKAELQLGIATVFRRYENQELFETTRADVDIKHDLFLPQADLKSMGVRVIFK
jgi:hypothetical protein